MIHDDQNKFNDQQAVTATGVSTDIIDLGVEGITAFNNQNLGVGEPMSVLIFVDVTAIVNDADETYEFGLETDSSAAFSSPVVIVSRAFTTAEATAELVAGQEAIVLAIPADERMERFARLAHTLGGTTPGITYTSLLQPTHGVPAIVRNGYPNNSVISA